jgi:hypothetical protein
MKKSTTDTNGSREMNWPCHHQLDSTVSAKRIEIVVIGPVSWCVSLARVSSMYPCDTAAAVGVEVNNRVLKVHGF